MTGRFNYTAPTNASAFDVPGDIADTYAFFDALLGEKVATAASLPAAAARPAGHIVSVDDTETLYRNSGSAWKRYYPVHAAAAGTHTISTVGTTGGSTPVFWSGVQTVTFPASRFSVAPIVTLSNIDPTAVYLAPQLVSVTASGFTYRAMRIDTFPAVGAVTHWSAVQMLSGAAAG